jgi:hypothetical protein
MPGRNNNPFGGGFDPANNPFGGGMLPSGGAFPSLGGGATPPPFTGSLPSGGMGAPNAGSPGGSMGLPTPPSPAMHGGPGPMRGNAYGFGMEQPPPQSGFLPNGNAFPGQGQGQPVPQAQPQRPIPQGPPMGGMAQGQQPQPAQAGSWSGWAGRPSPASAPPMAPRPERPVAGAEAAPRQFPREMLAAALNRRPV